MTGKDIESGALRLVLGDQLTPGLSALADLDPARDVVLMAEVAEETRYVPHHPKKIVLFLSAMRHFAQALRARGITVDYVRLDDPGNTGSLGGELARAVARHRPVRVVATHPGEWRVLDTMRSWSAALGLPVEIREDDRFLCSIDRFARHAAGRSTLRMEFFYREMRRLTGLLIEPDGTPTGGAWNFDAENRKALPRDIRAPAPFRVAPDDVTRDVIGLVGERFADHFGALDDFTFAVTAEDAERALAHFIAQGLPRFGEFQDAMRTGEDTLFHAVISPYLNLGLLDPLVACRAAEAAFRAGAVPINAAEGFIRQILGWREFIRGIYWLKMPDYAAGNALGAQRPLPAFFWTGQTKMNCLAQCIDQTRRTAYAHHIQRLMVTGNFALIAGLAPVEVERWYLAVYADAVEWVELPNTHGMVLHADGGLLASKPYAASGKYIQRMSDYCKGCEFDVRETVGPRACPFNFLYWDFLMRNDDRLRANPRMGLVYGALDRMDEVRHGKIRAQAAGFLAAL